MTGKMLICVPTYNERENVQALCSKLLSLELDTDILFLDDNSPDGTGQILDQLAQQHARLSVLHRSGKLGIGSAHQEGIRYAYEKGYQTLITMDCDFTHSPEDIPRLLAVSDQYDVTVGSRYMASGSLPGWNLMRRALTNIGHILTRLLLRMPYDATGAFRVYRLDRVPQGVFALVASLSYAFFFESMFILGQNNCRIGEVAIVLPARTYGHSKMAWREAARSALHVFSLYVANKTNPFQFRLSNRTSELDPSLKDPQNWDDYWKAQKSLSNLAYDVIAAIYRNSVIRRQLRRQIRRHFRPGSELLHAGCGSGQVDVGLHADMKITALDISPNALELYLRTNPDAQTVRHGSILALPFPDASYNGVYNLGVMEHFECAQIDQILKEFRRVLKPGGTIVIFWPHAKATSVFVLKIAHWVLKNAFKQNHRLHPAEISLIRSKCQAGEFLQRAGLELVKYSFGARDMFIQAVVVATKPRLFTDPILRSE
jgi:dolichol-phosphate mannosyltransferase